MQRRARLSKDSIIKIVGIAVAILLFFSILLVITDRIKKKEISSVSSSTEGTPFFDPYADEDQDPVIYYAGKAYTHKKNIETVLFMGIDSYGEAQEMEGHRNHDQVDVLMLAVINHDTKQYQVLQVNRDTMTEIPMIGSTGDRIGTIPAQIALSHTYGSGLQDSSEYTCEALTNLLMGEEVKHYITLKLDSIAIINHSVGGVEVTIPYDMTAYDETMTEGATILLSDKQAETFIRARRDLDDDKAINSVRMERQQTYLDHWKKKAKEKLNQDAGFALELILDLGDYMLTDYDLNSLSKLSDYLANYEYLGMTKIEGTYQMGEEFLEFYCDDTSLKDAVISLYYEEKAE
ncbi:MAG: LCP family protein [Clostridiales bacterium]|nr:LCP family protein [Clostridiales bacterium]